MTDFLFGWIPPEVWTAFDTFWLALSLWPWFLGATIVGIVIGAWIGRAGAALVVASILALLVLFRKSPEPDASEHFPNGHPDGPRRPVRKTAKRTPAKEKSLIERLTGRPE